MIEISDLSVIYLSYDEPQKEEFWLKIKNIVPWARRVDGVKGSDAAHKAAAEVSETERFIVIDGDNLPDVDFFNLDLDFRGLDASYQTAQFRWRARNYINGLCYGNGGLSSWTKTYVMQMKTHEASEGNPMHTVDFCLDASNQQYWSMHDCYSTTYPNYSSFQAWRAGFREGVKMCLWNGTKPTIQDFKDDCKNANYNNLTIWHNVGIDVDNGIYAIYGSRVGTYMTMLTDWDFSQVQDFDYLRDLWLQHISLDPFTESENLSDELTNRLGLPMCMLSKDQSKFFKRHLNSTRKNLGPLVKEIDVIRRTEY